MYESNIRVTGVGAGSSMSRLAGIIMPFVCYWAIRRGNYFAPYYIFLMVTIACLIVTL